MVNGKRCRGRLWDALRRWRDKGFRGSLYVWCVTGGMKGLTSCTLRAPGRRAECVWGGRGTGAREYYYTHAQAAVTAPAQDRMVYAVLNHAQGAEVKRRTPGTQAAGAQGLPSHSGSAPACRGTPAVPRKESRRWGSGRHRTRRAARVGKGMAQAGVDGSAGGHTSPGVIGPRLSNPAQPWWWWLYAIRVSAQRWGVGVWRDQRARVPYHLLRQGRNERPDVGVHNTHCCFCGWKAGMRAHWLLRRRGGRGGGASSAFLSCVLGRPALWVQYQFNPSRLLYIVLYIYGYTRR